MSHEIILVSRCLLNLDLKRRLEILFFLASCILLAIEILRAVLQNPHLGPRRRFCLYCYGLQSI
jgi:hypothetical protein